METHIYRVIKKLAVMSKKRVQIKFAESKPKFNFSKVIPKINHGSNLKASETFFRIAKFIARNSDFHVKSQTKSVTRPNINQFWLSVRDYYWITKPFKLSFVLKTTLLHRSLHIISLLIPRYTLILNRHEIQ